MTPSKNEKAIPFSGYSTVADAIDAVITKIVELTGWERGENNTLYFNEEKNLKLVISSYNSNINFQFYNGENMIQEVKTGNYTTDFTLYYHTSINGMVTYISLNKIEGHTFLVATNSDGNKTIFCSNGNTIKFFTPKYNTAPGYFTYTPGLMIDKHYPYSLSEATDFLNYSTFPELYYVKSYPVGTTYNMLVNFNEQVYRFASISTDSYICFAFPVSD